MQSQLRVALPVGQHQAGMQKEKRSRKQVNLTEGE